MFWILEKEFFFLKKYLTSLSDLDCACVAWVFGNMKDIKLSLTIQSVGTLLYFVQTAVRIRVSPGLVFVFIAGTQEIT